MKQKLKYLYNRIPNWCKNKYFISGFAFVIWIIFFDTNSLLMQTKKMQEIKKIKSDINYYNVEIKKDKKIIETLSQDSLTPELEQFFREELFISKKNEEVFMIEK